MRDQEEIEFSIDNFGLLNEAVVNICTLGRVQNLALGLLEESLTDTLVYND